MKRIEQYLLPTKDEGINLQPHTNFDLDMHIDADYAGMWHQEHSHLPECTLSRIGYVITYCGCHINWASKLQSEIALNTTESNTQPSPWLPENFSNFVVSSPKFAKMDFVSVTLNCTFSTTHTTHLETTNIYEGNA
jgi:hypothetical protein